ncbi:hypothetical protein [Zoogloea sp.]|nr:hypothetical protein [Zoogloea sp.]MCK6395048.1 hypothetical protein [Zoogloea sp.]
MTALTILAAILTSGLAIAMARHLAARQRQAALQRRPVRNSTPAKY